MITNALGLSAIQLGTLKNIIIINQPAIDKKYENMLLLINPIIVRHDDKPRKTVREGCLSIPNFYGRTKRYRSIEYQYFDIEEGIVKTSSACEMLACCIQHEIDHLNGILFIDLISSVERHMFDLNYKKLLEGVS
jgi:peptide deformylase